MNTIPRSLPLAALALALVAASACNKGGPTGSTCPTTSTLTYENFGQAFMNAHCTSCHSASGHGEPPLLDSVTAIRSAASEIDQTSASGPNATNDVMPEDAEVPESERKKLGEWLACGAP